jgi:hypothetical protein
MTPHGFIKAAQANNATVKVQTAEGRKQTIVSFTLLDNYNINGTLNDQNLVDWVETWIGNPVLGDLLVETSYSDYRDFDGVKFPGRIVQKQGGFPTLDLTILTVGSNNVATVAVPQNVLRGLPSPCRSTSKSLLTVSGTFPAELTTVSLSSSTTISA